MSPEIAEKKKLAALRESHVDLYHMMQETMNEIANEMLGAKEWDTNKVDRSLGELLEEIQDHFGMEDES